jgi:hypothetical protein
MAFQWCEPAEGRKRAVPAVVAHGGPGAGERWLCNTALLQHDHPRIRLLALRLTQLKGGAVEEALACYQHVRGLRFACAPDAPNTTAVEVVTAQAGDAYTKSTLLIALLRSLGIPARARLVTLQPEFLWGLVHTGGRPIEHVFTEIMIEGRWMGVDSYVVDLALGSRARALLRRHGRMRGYGVHMKGQVAWDGTAPSFGAFCRQDPGSLPLRDLGAFDDIGVFCRSTDEPLRPGWARKQQWALAAAMINWRIRKLREGPASSPQ